MSHFLINCIVLQKGSCDGTGGGGGGGGRGGGRGAGKRMAREKGSEGRQVSSCLFLKECHWVCIKAGFKKASSINDSFISEVKSREG